MITKKRIPSITVFVHIFIAAQHTHTSLEQELKTYTEEQEFQRKRMLTQQSSSTPILSQEEQQRIMQEQALLNRRYAFEIGKQGQPASNKQPWNFELQNKWRGGFIEVVVYNYGKKNINSKEYLLRTPLMPTEKVRTAVDINKQLIIEIYYNKKIFKKIVTSLQCNLEGRPAACYKTIHLTLGSDGSVYPQTGVFYGLTKRTDSGLNNAYNILPSEFIYQTFSIKN